MKAPLFVVAGFTVVGAFFAVLRAQNAIPQPTPAPESHSVWDGVYTEKQAARGEALYEEYCSSCHGDKLTGNTEEDIPALVGGHFSNAWNGRTAGDLFKKILRTMPQDDPGRLKREQSADVVAFLLSANTFPAGKAELPVEERYLAGIRIEAKPTEKPGSGEPSR